MLMTIVGVLVGLLILGVIIVGIYISIQGDAVMRLLVKQQRQAHVNTQARHTAEGNAHQHAEEKSQQIHGDENHI